MSLEGAQAHIVGFWDGYRGLPADTTIIHSECRKDYLQGWYSGQRKYDEDHIVPPEWVNGTRGEK